MSKEAISFDKTKKVVTVQGTDEVFGHETELAPPSNPVM